MKKFILMMVVVVTTFTGDLIAKPKVHLEGSIDISIGKAKRGCDGIWLCLSNGKINGRIELGMISNNHGLVLDDDGTLSIAINQDLIKRQDIQKYNILNRGMISLDSEETLDEAELKKLGFNGSNIFKAGEYKVIKYQNYFLINLN